MPLLRYHIADQGGIIAFDGLLARVRTHGFDPLATLQNPAHARPLPFVYLFGRADFTVSY